MCFKPNGTMKEQVRQSWTEASVYTQLRDEVHSSLRLLLRETQQGQPINLPLIRL